MDVVRYTAAAMDRFEGMGEETLRIMVCDLVVTGSQGLLIIDPSKTYRLKALPNEYTGLQNVSYMYAGLKALGEDLNIGPDLSKEYEAALSLKGGHLRCRHMTHRYLRRSLVSINLLMPCRVADCRVR